MNVAGIATMSPVHSVGSIELPEIRRRSNPAEAAATESGMTMINSRQNNFTLDTP
jgi:hypothetical protein